MDSANLLAQRGVPLPHPPYKQLIDLSNNNIGNWLIGKCDIAGR